MFNKVSIRKKIAIFRISLLMLFLLLLFPFSTTILEQMVYHAMKQQAKALIGKLQEKSDEEAMVVHLNYHDQATFFYTTLVNKDLQTKFDARRFDFPDPGDSQIGRASCRERV